MQQAATATVNWARKTGCILIADDDVLVSAPLRKILIARGYSADCVETGADALAALSTGKYDVLITDICMPGNFALDLLSAPEVVSKNVPVILITGYPTLDTAVSAVKHGVVDYIIKPVQPPAFLASVERALSKREQTSAVSQLEQHLSGVNVALASVKHALSTVGNPQGTPSGSQPPRGTEDEIVQARLTSSEFSTLSKREREILVFLARGGSAAAIAASLGISPSTVRNHLKSVYRKLGVRSQVALVRKLLV